MSKNTYLTCFYWSLSSLCITECVALILDLFLKLYGNIKALALEVADKHDEVRELKRQVGCLEDEIQKATKKIQFKDDVIKELRNDLKRNAKVSKFKLFPLLFQILTSCLSQNIWKKNFQRKTSIKKIDWKLKAKMSTF